MQEVGRNTPPQLAASGCTVRGGPAVAGLFVEWGVAPRDALFCASRPAPSLADGPQGGALQLCLRAWAGEGERHGREKRFPRRCTRAFGAPTLRSAGSLLSTTLPRPWWL